MGKTNMWLQNALAYTKKNWFIFFAVAVYIFFTAYYMGPGFTRCQDSIYGFGDSTAGPIWKNSLKPEQPILGGFETSTNYPYGESLYSPVNYASAVQSVSMEGLSSIAGPVCAYNLYNILGYVSTAIVMFAFIYYLVRNRWLALLAGYAVSFTPYVQSKVGGHPSYGYASLLIAALWLTIHLLVHRKKIHAILLGVVLGICAYFDPYFILLALTIVVPTFIVWLVVTLRSSKKNRLHECRRLIRQLAKPVLTSLVIFSLVVAPLVAIRIKDAKLIESTVSGVRGNVVQAAELCSNKPLDYLLPDPSNIYLVKIFGNKYSESNISHRNWCGYGESRVSISLTMLAVISLGVVAYAWRKRYGKAKSRSQDFLPYRPKLLVGIVGATGLTAILIGLPPHINGLIMPSDIILKITEMWRIFAREYLVVNMAVVVLFAVTLAWLMRIYSHRIHKWVKIGLVIFIAVGVFAEYQINNPFSPITFSYSRDIPSVYKQIHKDKDIAAIAEYPMDRTGLEFDSSVYYLTMQGYHGKRIVNSATNSNKLTEKLHIAMKDLTDPQTLPLLRYLNVHYVVIHGEKLASIEKALSGKVTIMAHDTPVVYALTMVRPDKDRDIVLVHIMDGPEQSNALTIEKGLVVNLPLIQSPLNTEFETVQDTELKLNSLAKKRYSGTICFDAKMSAVGDVSKLSIKSTRGALLYQTMLTDQYQKILVPAATDDRVILHNEKGYNVRLNNLNVGCNG